MFFSYDTMEKEYIMEKDEKLAKHILEIGDIKREQIPDLFEAIIFFIISQQITSKAAKTISTKIKHDLNKITPKKIIECNETDFQRYGISKRKADYMQNCAKAIINGEIDLNNITKLENDDFINELSKLKGIASWSAHMLLIFSLNRKNVFPLDDYGIQSGLMAVHNLETITKEDKIYFKQLYSPYASIAAIYLWDIGNRYDRKKKVLHSHER